MTLPDHIFRAYDIRGIAEDELTNEVVLNIGKAFATKLKREGKTRIAVGHDMRPSSERIRKALIEGLMACGAQVVNLGLTPTPLLYFSVSHYKIDAGVSITGSHNPPEYNGLKLHLSDRPFYGDEIEELKELIEKKDFEESAGKSEDRSILEDYIKEVSSQFEIKRKIKVVIDSGHGMGGMVAPRLIKGLGCEVVELYSNLDSNFPDHHPDPSVLENMKDLQAKVLETKSDLGIAFDGDADRIGVVDEKGTVLLGDRLMLIFARGLLEEAPGATIIGDVKCSKLLYDDIRERGGNPVMWKTGHSVIKSKMKETKAALAGEMSGHIFFAHRWFGFDDAIYSACRFLEILDRTGKSVSELIQDIPILSSTPEIRKDCEDDKKFEVVRLALEAFKQKYKVTDIDGARIEFEDGWGLVRASNTGPVLVMRFEAANDSRLKEIQTLIESQIDEIEKSLA